MITLQVSPRNKRFLHDMGAPVPLMFLVSPSMSPRELLIVTEYRMSNLPRSRLSYLGVLASAMASPSSTSTTSSFTIILKPG